MLIQGITGKSGYPQAKAMLDAGTNVVAGVTPGKGGQEVHGVPVYNSIAEAKGAHPEINAIICFVPSAFCLDAVYEAVDAGIKLVVVTTEEIAIHDVVRMKEYAKLRGSILYGPGCAGIISPGQSKLGVHPAQLFTPGRVGVVSKSGSMSYLMGKTLTDEGIGQSTVAALGGGPLWGYTMQDAVRDFNEDPDTDVIVILGEIGGNQEELAADYIKAYGKKPVVSLITGRHAPAGKRMGHAGAIIHGDVGTAEGKNKRLKDAGVATCVNLVQLIDSVKSGLAKMAEARS